MFNNIGSKLKSIIVFAFWFVNIVVTLVTILFVLGVKDLYEGDISNLYIICVIGLIVFYIANYIYTLFVLSLAQITANTDKLANEMSDKFEDLSYDVKSIKAIVAPLFVDKSINDSMLNKKNSNESNNAQFTTEHYEDPIEDATNSYEQKKEEEINSAKNKDFFNFLNEEFENNSKNDANDNQVEGDDSEPLKPWLSEDFFEGK